MLKLYHSPRSRSVRIVWLLEELGLPYELEVVDFQPPLPPARPFAQRTPSGKVPTLVDGDVVLFESGAIVEWVIERHGGGRLASPPASPSRAPYLQWLHFAEATAFPPIGNIAWHRFRGNADAVAPAIADYETWAAAAFDVLERALDGRDWLVGDALSGADVMMGYTVQVADWFGLVGDARPNVARYLERLAARPAFRRALAA